MTVLIAAEEAAKSVTPTNREEEATKMPQEVNPEASAHYGSKPVRQEQSGERNDIALKNHIRIGAPIEGAVHSSLDGIQVCASGYHAELIVQTVLWGESADTFHLRRLAEQLGVPAVLLRYAEGDDENNDPIEMTLWAATGVIVRQPTKAEWSNFVALRVWAHAQHIKNQAGATCWVGKLTEKHEALGGPATIINNSREWQTSAMEGSTSDTDMVMSNSNHRNQVQKTQFFDLDGIQTCFSCGAVEAVFEATSAAAKQTINIRERAMDLDAVAIFLRHRLHDEENVFPIEVAVWNSDGSSLFPTATAGWDRLAQARRYAHERHSLLNSCPVNSLPLRLSLMTKMVAAGGAIVLN